MNSAIRTIVLISLCTLTACATSTRRSTDEDSDFAKIPVIDAHVHTEFSGEKQKWSGVIKSREAFLAEMKANHVVGAVSHTSQELGNIHDLSKENVIYCAGAGKKIAYDQIERGLRDKKYRCIKIYLGYVYRWANDSEYKRLYAMARKYKVPVVFHTGDTYDTDGLLKYADPLTIDEVAVEFRDVDFVIAHIGNPWIQSAAEVAYKNSNVYLEGSALLIGDLASQDPEKVYEYVTKPIAWAFGYLEDPSKLMFGTDWPLNTMKGYMGAFRAAIPREHWRAVFHDNAARVFHLNP